MPMSISAPAPTAGDCKLLYSVYGTLATGAAGAVEIGHFTLPALQDNQYILAVVSIYRTAGADTLLCGINTATATIAAGDLCYASYAAGNTYQFIYVTRGGGTAANLFGWNPLVGAPIFTENSASLGDITANKEMYWNITRRVASSYTYNVKIMLFGSGVK